MAKIKAQRPPKIPSLKARIVEHIDQKTYRDTVHATERREQRNITLPEMIEVLRNGYHEKSKDKFDEQWKSWNYSMRGKTDCEKRELRVIVAFDESTEMLIITAIDLDLN